MKEKKFLLALALSFLAFVLGFGLCIYEVREGKELKDKLFSLHLNKGEKVIIGIKSVPGKRCLPRYVGYFLTTLELM